MGQHFFCHNSTYKYLKIVINSFTSALQELSRVPNTKQMLSKYGTKKWIARIHLGQSALTRKHQKISDNPSEAGSGLIPPGKWNIIRLTNMPLLTVFWPIPEVG